MTREAKSPLIPLYKGGEMNEILLYAQDDNRKSGDDRKE
jgi:hypothetical protein